MDKKVSKSILSYLPKSDRLLLVKLKASPFNMHLIVAYAPRAEADESVLAMFNESLDDLYKNCTSQEINILLGDYNAKLVRENKEKLLDLVDWVHVMNVEKGWWIGVKKKSWL